MAQLSWERMASQLFARTCHERKSNLGHLTLDLARIVVDHFRFRGVVHFKRNSLRCICLNRIYCINLSQISSETCGLRQTRFVIGWTQIICVWKEPRLFVFGRSPDYLCLGGTKTICVWEEPRLFVFGRNQDYLCLGEAQIICVWKEPRLFVISLIITFISLIFS